MTVGPTEPRRAVAGRDGAVELAMSELPVPWGWFAVGFSHELPLGRVVTRRLAGEEVVVWRGADGGLGASVPTCPHLGAHLGRGSVVGSDLRCPFHAFTFAPDGRCTSTGGPAAPPAGLRVGVRNVCERNGALLVWHHPDGLPPSFEVPEPEMLPMTSVDRSTTSCFELAGHPVATSENSVDLAHLAAVHRYTDVEMESSFRTDGTAAFVSYSMTRPLGLPVVGRLPLLRRATTRVRFDVSLFGLGVSVVEATIASLGIRTRQLVLSTPVAAGRIEMRLAMQVLHEPSRWRRPAEVVGARVAALGFAHDVRQDLPIWDEQRYVTRPALSHGDGPIVPYRRWAQQFLDRDVPVQVAVDRTGAPGPTAG